MGKPGSGGGCSSKTRMRATHLCVALVIAACVLGSSALPEDDGAASLGEESGSIPAPEVNPQQQRFNKKMEAVRELHEEAQQLRSRTNDEREGKAAKASEYMSQYAIKKEILVKDQAKIQTKIDADRAVVSRGSKGDEKASELRKKHDKRIKGTMKVALDAMRKVESVTSNRVPADPLMIDAQKRIMTARSNEMYTTLGLDKNQIATPYLMKMDNAIKAYNEMPDTHNGEKMEKALTVVKERVAKEKQVEIKTKKEVAAKNQRSADNKAYYNRKWKEKEGELTRKKNARDTYVHKLKAENKFKKWVQEQNENESGHKKTIFEDEKGKKHAIETAHKVQRKKVYAANSNVVEQAKKKFEFEQTELQKKLDAAASDYTTKKNELVAAKESREKTRASMSTLRANAERAKELEGAAKSKADKSEALKAQFASEANFAAAKSDADALDVTVKASAESNFKYTAVISTMNEKDKIQDEKDAAVATALKAKLAAEEAVTEHKAKRALEIEEANKPPDVIDSGPASEMDPNTIMNQQMQQRNNMLPAPAVSEFPTPKIEDQDKQVQEGAGVQDPGGTKQPLQAPPGFDPPPGGR